MTSTVTPNEPVLTMRLASNGTGIALERAGISDSDWASIAVMVTGTLPVRGQPLLATAADVVSRAHTLQQILLRIPASLRADEPVTQVLRRIRSDKDVLASLLAGSPVTRPAPAVDGRHTLRRTLRHFQVADLERLWAMRHGANFSVPGAGKTTVSLALHLRERAAGRVERLLVVAPLSAFEAWEEEASSIIEPPLTTLRWTGQLTRDVDVVIVNYQRLAAAVPALSAWMSSRRVHLIVDEAHRAKRGGLGEWGRGILGLAPLAARRDILTGTPAPNHPRDLIALLDIVWPGGMASRSLPQDVLASEPSRTSLRALNSRISPLFVRTTKGDLQLPPVTYVPTPPIPMGPLQRDIYDAMVKRYAGMLDLGNHDADMFARLGEVAMYLIQAASSPQLLATASDPSRSYRFPPLAIPPGSQLARLIDTYSDHEIPSKIAETCRIVFRNSEHSPPRKTLVWSNFPGNLLALETQLAALQPAIVYGGIPSTEDADPGVRTRERELRRFRTDPNCLVLLANPAAMSEGVSLHHVCHDAVYLDRTFNAGQYLQSLDRIHRLGLPPESETRFYLLASEGTIDERIGRRLRVKVERLGQMLNDSGLATLSLPDDENAGDVVDDNLDLNEILDHLSGRSWRGDD